MIIRIQGEAQKQNGIYYTYDTNSIPLGEGGMGIVFPGYCVKEDNPNEYLPVAIKKVTSNSQEVIERAMLEASIQIDHPNLLRMYGFIPNMEQDPVTGSLQPRYYVIMERLVGVNLDSVMTGITMDKNGVPIPYAAKLYNLYKEDRWTFTREVMGGILRGISYLHATGIIHRDIDPSNVMVTQEGNIKLIDFGICKSIAANVPTFHKKTQHGAIIGKLDYAAPEIVIGDVEHHNFTTDIYALGIMLFQFYTGFLPFQGDNVKVMQSQLNSPLPLINIDHPELKRIIEKATQKNQCDRYQSVDQMLADLLAADKRKQTGPMQKHLTNNGLHPIQVGYQKEHSDSLIWWLTGIAGLLTGIVSAIII